MAYCRGKEERGSSRKRSRPVRSKEKGSYEENALTARLGRARPGPGRRESALGGKDVTAKAPGAPGEWLSSVDVLHCIARFEHCARGHADDLPALELGGVLAESRPARSREIAD